MQADTQTDQVSKTMLWIGYILSALPVLMLLFSGAMKVMNAASVVEGFARFGYPENVAFGIGVVELISPILYVIPQTSFSEQSC